MTLLARLEVDHLTPGRLWSALDHDTRVEATRCLYDRDYDDADARRDADAALARALRFRPVMVRRLPVEKRIGHLAKLDALDDSVAYSLLIALHMVRRRPMLAAFLDELGIEHDDGLIRDDRQDVSAPSAEALARARDKLLASFPEHEVDVYLATLLAMDAEVWKGVAGLAKTSES